MVEVKLLTDTARCPTKGSFDAAGYDIYADDGGIVTTGSMEVVSTGVAVKIPQGYVGLIKPRSGLAFKHGVDTMAGVIDSDYRGEIKVMLTTHTDKSYFVTRGDRIAQLLIIPVVNLENFKVVDDFNDSTERGEKGFGSSGI